MKLREYPYLYLGSAREAKEYSNQSYSGQR